uniref:Wbp11/ELF5/Saf1 N-terminal domain-containing protein n=2 Tax=Canis lupus familiaris TaxID=9615 RepID=A0A8C0QCN2_CANLF
MGRRSTSSTKSGKFINPTEQAQKEAQKRELKKNKKQRMMVALKWSPVVLFCFVFVLFFEMEFNSVQQPQLNERMLKDKGKKLRETFERILRLYEKENPDIYKELRNGIRTEEAQNLLNGVMMMMFPAPVKMMDILRTWIKISMMTVLMTETLTGQMEKVKGMNLCTVMIKRETTMKKRSQSVLSVRFADMPGKSRKKKKNMKELTPLQAIMLQMAGQDIPEEVTRSRRIFRG